MNTPRVTEPTPRDRLRAGEIVRFAELSPADMADLFPRFGDTWQRVAAVDIAVIPQPVEGQAAA